MWIYSLIAYSSQFSHIITLVYSIQWVKIRLRHISQHFTVCTINWILICFSLNLLTLNTNARSNTDWSISELHNQNDRLLFVRKTIWHMYRTYRACVMYDTILDHARRAYTVSMLLFPSGKKISSLFSRRLYVWVCLSDYFDWKHNGYGVGLFAWVVSS